jgi:hypothetical protein
MCVAGGRGLAAAVVAAVAATTGCEGGAGCGGEAVGREELCGAVGTAAVTSGAAEPNEALAAVQDLLRGQHEPGALAPADTIRVGARRAERIAADRSRDYWGWGESVACHTE